MLAHLGFDVVHTVCDTHKFGVHCEQFQTVVVYMQMVVLTWHINTPQSTAFVCLGMF